MQKWGRWALALSLILNLVLILSLIWVRQSQRERMTKLGLYVSNSAVIYDQTILRALESGEQEDIDRLKELVEANMQAWKDMTFGWPPPD